MSVLCCTRQKWFQAPIRLNALFANTMGLLKGCSCCVGRSKSMRGWEVYGVFANRYRAIYRLIHVRKHHFQGCMKIHLCRIKSLLCSHWMMQYLGTPLISGALTTYTTWSRHLYTRQCLPQKAIYPWHCFALLSKLSVDQAYFQISVELQKALPFMAISVTIIAQLASTLPLSPMPIAWHYIYHALAAYHLLPCVHMLGVPSRESLENTVHMIQKILEASS